MCVHLLVYAVIPVCGHACVFLNDVLMLYWSSPLQPMYTDPHELLPVPGAHSLLMMIY